jgi:DNA-binding transcriptional LysR family regulator
VALRGVKRGAALPVSGKLRTDDKDCALQAASAGIAIAHLPSWIAAEDIVAGRLVPLFPDAQSPKRKSLPAIHAVRMPGRSYEEGVAVHRAPRVTPYWDMAIDRHRARAPARRARARAGTLPQQHPLGRRPEYK